MTDIFTIFLIFGTIFIIIDLFIVTNDIDPIIERRLLKIKEGDLDSNRQNVNTDEIFNTLKKREKLKQSNVLEMLKEHSDYRLQFLAIIFNKFRFIDKVKYLLKIADVKMPVDLFFMIIGSIILPFVILAMLNNNFIFLIIGGGAGIIPFVYLKMKFSKRLEMFTQQFPDALGIIANSLRAGHSLLSAFQMVASESPYPINKVFKTVSDEISLGREIRDALEAMSINLPNSQDLKFFVIAVLIQKEVGGNLAEILDNLNNTIRERYKLLGLIKTQTAQAQLSGIVLGMAPVVITGLISLLNPSYMKPLFTTSMGNLILAGALGMSVLGYVVIQKITQIRV